MVQLSPVAFCLFAASEPAEPEISVAAPFVAASFAAVEGNSAVPVIVEGSPAASAAAEDNSAAKEVAEQDTVGEILAVDSDYRASPEVAAPVVYPAAAAEDKPAASVQFLPDTALYIRIEGIVGIAAVSVN